MVCFFTLTLFFVTNTNTNPAPPEASMSCSYCKPNIYENVLENLCCENSRRMFLRHKEYINLLNDNERDRRGEK